MGLQKLAIIGAGGFGREVLDVVDAINAVAPTFEVAGFVVDEAYGRPGDLVNEVPIAGDLDWLRGKRGEVMAVCAVGAPEHRLHLTRAAEAAGVGFATLIHPRATLTRWVTLGEGSVVTAGCVITNQVTIGRHAHVNLTSTIGHDAVLRDHVTLAPGVHLSGRTVMEEGAYLGTGANVIEGVTVGAWAIVGAGSTVVSDIPANTTAVGAPARVIKTRDEGWHLR